jgi:hypothetical protein
MFSLTLMSKEEKRCVLDATVGDLSRTMQSFRVAINAKGEIVGMFTRRMCLSLMERIAAMMVCLQARKEAMMANRESISLGEANNMQRRERSEEITVSKSVDEVQVIKTRRRIKG